MDFILEKIEWVFGLVVAVGGGIWRFSHWQSSMERRMAAVEEEQEDAASGRREVMVLMQKVSVQTHRTAVLTEQIEKRLERMEAATGDA